MTGQRSARELLVEADRQKRIAEAAEDIRRSFRLGSGVAVKKGRFGVRKMFRRHDEPEQWKVLEGAAAAALYDAALIVRRDAIAEAERLERLVHVEEGRP